MTSRRPPRRPPRPTSAQVAARAGVSRTTVSFVLNGVEGASISEATRERVLEAAREMGYVPSAAARTLASGRTRTIGLILCRAEHLAFDATVPAVLHGLSGVSRAADFRVLVEAVEDLERPHAYLDLVHAKHIDGLAVLSPRADDPQLPELAEAAFPTVVIGSTRVPGLASVDVDNVEATKAAVRHLAALGRRRIAYVTFAPEGGSSSSRERLRGYREARAELDLPWDPALVAHGDYDAESGLRAARGLLARGTPFDALAAGNDTVAFGAMRALREAGLSVPGDVAVLGFDDVPLAAFAEPPLTTVRLPAVRLGRLAARTLLDQIEGRGAAGTRTLLPADLVVRASCGERAPDPVAGPALPT